MKLSLSIPEDDVRFLDEYASAKGLGSRSAAVHAAVRLLRATELGPAYEEAFAEWVHSDVAAQWDVSAADGLGSDAPR